MNLVPDFCCPTLNRKTYVQLWSWFGAISRAPKHTAT